jgi:hypothetical protein
VDVKNYQKLAGKLDTIAPWEQRLWGLYDALDCPVNFINTTLVAYSGEVDAQKAAADLMESALAREGIRMTHIIGSKTGHQYEPAAKKTVARLVDAAVERGLNHQPTNISFVTRTLKFNRMHWLTVEALDKHWDEARVDAQIVPGNGGRRIEVRTRNVAAFGIHLAPADILGRGARLVVDGQDLGVRNTVFSLPPPGSPGNWWNFRVRKSGGRWGENTMSPGATMPLAKRHNLQGPIDDAFTGSFLVVRPTGEARDLRTASWLMTQLAKATNDWRGQFRGDARVKNDSQVTDADIAAHHLVLFGDPQSNKLLARIADKLPIGWSSSSVKVGEKSFPAASHVPVLIFPNPLNPQRYVVLNTGFTFAAAGTASNAQQTPKLPDYAVLDLDHDGAVALADFFNEDWKLN